MRVIDQVSSPGTSLGGGAKKGNDDRFAFDEAANWASVVDGATDVGPVRIFSKAHTDAEHFAEIFSVVLQKHPSQANESPPQYFERLLPKLRAAVEADMRVPLKDAPLSSYPTAAATWLRWRKSMLEVATLGDSLAIVRTPDGQVRIMGEPVKAADEQGRAKRVMAMTPEQRLKWLADVRAIHNTEKGYWVFGVQPEAAAKIVHQNVAAPVGTRVLLMTDGFYRLVTPYGRYDDAGLIAKANEAGLGALLSELRSLEADPGDDAKIGRFKTSDDATALLLEF